MSAPGERPIDSTHSPARGSRRWRWLIGLAAMLLLLAAYGVALDWFANRIGADIQRSVRTVPGIEDRKHRAH